MNETMSLVLATAILAIGGLGLYMYKQTDDEISYIEDENYYDYENMVELIKSYLQNFYPKTEF